MVAVYLVKNKEHLIRKCTEEDISGHYDIVHNLVTDTEEGIYKANMLNSVNQGTAYVCEVNGEPIAFLYIHKVINMWLGASIWGNTIVGITLLFKELYEAIGDVSIRYAPHKGALSSMKTLVTKKSIRLYHNNKGYVRIKTGELYDKFKRIYETLKVEQCQLL